LQQPHPEQVDALYLFARRVEWERNEDPSAGWELISAAHSADEDTRAHARALLSGSQHLWGMGSSTDAEIRSTRRRSVTPESDMNTPYDVEIIEDCAKCTCTNAGFFCGFSDPLLAALNKVSQKSTLPAGAILFVEGQTPRGVFIICSGKVNLSTSSREGKTLILKTAVAGEALGLSAAISGLGYETTAETATPCQVNFVDRNHFLELLEAHGEVGLHSAQSLSRDYHAAYRDIHDLVLTRSSTGKLARLLLSISAEEDAEDETSILSWMTHEEMGHRIGASRETVTRLLGKLRKKRLIRLDGDSLVIRDRSGLEALTI
jgi:CRP/FNR family transcriptional regulator